MYEGPYTSLEAEREAKEDAKRREIRDRNHTIWWDINLITGFLLISIVGGHQIFGITKEYIQERRAINCIVSKINEPHNICNEDFDFIYREIEQNYVKRKITYFQAVDVWNLAVEKHKKCLEKEVIY